MTLSPPALPTAAIEDACEWAIGHGMALKTAPGMARHCAFSLAPVAISAARYRTLMTVTPLIARLVNGIAEDPLFLQQALTPMAKADPFFGHLLRLHRRLHGGLAQPKTPARLPLLILRTDYMDDQVLGPQVIEFNGIAAGMGPFGQRVSELHHHLRQHTPEVYRQWAEHPDAEAVENAALTQLAQAIAAVARRMRIESGEAGAPTFVMVVQEHEDNVYDQRLLSEALQEMGIRTLRRTFRQLHGTLSTGPDQRLLLDDVGGIDVVYLRAGYQYGDYFATDLEEQACCEALTQTRELIEQHRVAVNATVSQQLATSKTVQMLLSQMSPEQMGRWGLTPTQARQVKSLLAPMKPVNADIIAHFAQEYDPTQWVLKNQGEGGGHCLFGEAIQPRLNAMDPAEYDAWALMWRLHPALRNRPTIAVRDGVARQVDNLVSELGLFTVHFNGQPMSPHNGYCGYLIRSKPADENEGGVHSGQGMLDSLTLLP
ncbi:glutathione synthase [Ferrimonas balearica]|uniref:glutathione synthase n=1 Tax=Ferrimonas balearica TaxID=44012 RepID=UPI001C58ADA9|nr:glutathione synthase [Ferrimonas balearica]MBW3139158.1 glutathione synthase [Ferrimonas balearica]